MIDYGKNLAEKCKLGRDSAATEAGQGKMPPRSGKTPVQSATVIELVGDVGAGKTTLTRGLAEGLGVTEPVTSPSFTISKAYALPSGGRLVHYDFYRLGSPGLMVDDLRESLTDPRNVVVIEWGESVAGLLPADHLRIELSYSPDGTRELNYG